MSIKKKIEKINKLLIGRFGVPPRRSVPPDPVDTLVATILSQNTNDKNSYKAFTNLKTKFENWQQVAALSQNEIEKEIKVAGLGKQKSKAIKNFLTSIIKNRGSISLNHIRSETNET
ncbi:MAG: endonuclease III, partial [Ignavibacteriaceae bacterium]|nr:endonuclease III [Ignavibacteriaceae bacterium]